MRIVCLNKIINKENDMFMLIEEDENKSHNITVAIVLSDYLLDLQSLLRCWFIMNVSFSHVLCY